MLDKRAASLYDEGDLDALRNHVETLWEGESEGVPSGAADASRYLAILLTSTDQHAEADFWRARAHVAALLNGERDVLAGLLITMAFQTVRRALELTRQATDLDAARGILEEMRRLIPASSSLWTQHLARLYHDKRAYTYVTEAQLHGLASAPGRFALEQAEREYTASLALSRLRARAKVEGSLALVRYLLARTDPRTAAAGLEAQIEATLVVQAAAAASGWKDVLEWANTNLDAMRGRHLGGWVAYEHP